MESVAAQQEAAAQHVAEQLALLRGADKPALVGKGTEFLFFTACNDGRSEGYRVPRAPVFDTANNPSTAAKGLQEKEFELSKWAAGHGIPSARVEEIVEVRGYPVLVLEVIDDDGSALESSAVGSLLARMHRAAPPDFMVHGSEQNFGQFLAQRLSRRYALTQESLQLPRLPDQAALESWLNAELVARSVAHLDVRRQNFRVSSGMPTALFDWSNALLAPPEIEAARLAEYSLIEDNGIDYNEFLAGYQQSGGRLRDQGAAWRVLQLDTAIMLTGVFRSLAENKRLARLFADRASELAESL